MTELMLRRRALMAAKNDTPLALVDGSYYDGEIIVENGNHLIVNVQGRQWRSLSIPFNRTIDAANGDVFTIAVVDGSPIRGNMGFLRQDSTFLQAADDYWGAPARQNVTETTDTAYTGFFVRNRSSGAMSGNYTISLKKNGEVIL